MLGEQDVALTQAWLNDLSAAGYKPPSEIHHGALAPEVKNEVKAAAEVSQQRELQKATLMAQEKNEPPHVILAIAVVSVHPERRRAIRNSWLKWQDDRVVVRFFTEAPTKGDPGAEAEAAVLEAESVAYGDLVVLDIARGMNFAVKLLAVMRVMQDQYRFDFFLRLDDDYFLCLHRQLNELEALRDSTIDRETLFFYGGSWHCVPEHTRVDEAYLLLSAALVKRVLSAKHLQCKPHAGVTVGRWFTPGAVLNTKGDIQAFFDRRLDQTGKWWKRTSRGGAARSDYAGVCDTHMGIHHTYADGMAALWEKAKDTPGPPGADGTEALAVYADVGDCAADIKTGVTKANFNDGKAQHCDSFISTTDVYCGHEGC